MGLINKTDEQYYLGPDGNGIVLMKITGTINLLA